MDKKLSFKQILVVASTLFGMIFGAGNLIFPIHMGQLAGSAYLPATAGFLITGVGIPILGVVAIGFSESSGLFSLSSNVSKKFAFIYTTILYLAIGPCCVMPRSASIAYGAGLAAIIGNGMDQRIAFFIFSVIFFVVVTFFSLRPSGITTSVGKVINPLYLIFLFFLLITALTNPMASVTDIQPLEEYATAPVFKGFIEGYGTMDALAGLAFGIILIDIVKRMGVKTPGGITKNIMIPSLMTGALMMTIYTLTILMGVESRGVFDVSSNGSVALSDVSNYYFGIAGNAILTTIVTLGALKTSIGLVTSCSTAFNEMFPKRLSYKVWALICVALSFSISNAGLDTILEVSAPVLFFLSPVSIVLIFLAFAGKLFNHSSIVYKWTIGFTCIPAVFDFFAHFPVWIQQGLSIEWLFNLGYEIFPLMDIGFSWVIPAAIGFLIGIIIYTYKKSSRGKNEKLKKN